MKDDRGGTPGGTPGGRFDVAGAARAALSGMVVPANLNWLWNVGACIMATLGLLVVSGVFLALQYAAEPDRAFAAVEAIDRRVAWGWLIRSLHMAGASLLFAGLAVHVWRSLYYGSYKAPREIVWLSGTLLLLVAMGSSFLGYVLPFGQMSYWGLVVATHAMRMIPVFGDAIAGLLLGGPDIGAATLHRAFVAHIVLGFVAVAIVRLHVVSLHAAGSNNPAGVDPPPGGVVAFFPHHAGKVAVAALCWLLLAVVLATFLPYVLTERANYLPADPGVTPGDIAPEWYFLPSYAIIRAVPGFAGVVLAAGFVLVLPALPWLDRSPVRRVAERPVFRIAVLALIPVVLLLGHAGAEQTRGVWLTVARFATFWWFSHFLVLLPVLSARMRTV